MKDLLKIKRTIEARKKCDLIIDLIGHRADTIQQLESMYKYGMIGNFKVVQHNGALQIKVWNSGYVLDFIKINGATTFSNISITLQSES